MSKAIPLLFFSFLFIFLFSLPGHAYLDIDVNATGAGVPVSAMACTNTTGTFYCYMLSSGTPPTVYRYNATWGDVKTCSVGAVGAYAGTYWRGISIANATHLIAVKNNGMGANLFRLIPIWNMTGSTTCTSTGDLSPGFNESGASVTFSGGYYEVGDNTTGWIYWGLSNGIRNSTANTWIQDGFWDSSNLNKISLPNYQDNTTMYGEYGNLIFKYVGGAIDSYPGQTDVTWGFDMPSNPLWDTWETGATTWLYVYTDYVDNRLYRVNLTELEESGESYIVAVSPISTTVLDSTPQLHSIVYSASDGTVGWFIDGVYQTNQTFTHSVTNATDVYYTPGSALSEGSHNWTAYFYPSGTGSFDTGTQTFSYSTSGYTGEQESTDNLKIWINQTMQSSYGTEIVALMCAILIGCMFWYKTGTDSIYAFVIPFMLTLAIAAMPGIEWFPSWFLLFQGMFIAMFLFFKVKDG